jgi:hypothetical protein
MFLLLLSTERKSRSFASFGSNNNEHNTKAMTKSVADPQWNKQYQKLVEFQRNNGNCIVPQKYQEDASLGLWVRTQRRSHSNSKLRLDRKVLLDEIGFAWNVNQTWHRQYEKLVAFQRKNGNCLVARGYKENASLGVWVNKQRQLLTNNKLRLDRKDLLNKIGFVWKAPGVAANNKNNDKTWQQQFEKLVEFKQKNGHCLVPRIHEEDASLGNWVHRQRNYHANTKLRPDRKKLLDEIGFVWKVDPRAAARSPSTNVRGLVITASLFHALFKSFSNSRSCSAFNLCVLGLGFGFRNANQQSGTSKRNT